MVDTLRSLARPREGTKRFTTRGRKWRNSDQKEESPWERERREGGEGRERIESVARPVLGIRRGEKNRPGRLTKEALIAAGSRERTSRLKSSLFFSFCLLIRLFFLSLSLSFSLFLFFSLSAFPFFRRHSFARYEIGWATRVLRKANPINFVARAGGWPATCSHIYAPRTTKFARTISPFHALNPFRPEFPRVADRRLQLPGYSPARRANSRSNGN